MGPAGGIAVRLGVGEGVRVAVGPGVGLGPGVGEVVGVSVMPLNALETQNPISSLIPRLVERSGKHPLFKGINPRNRGAPWAGHP